MRRCSCILLTIPLPLSDYQSFVTAIRRLRRIMGAKAPDILCLIQTNLQERDARGLAEDYLDAVGWRYAKRRERKGGLRQSMPRGRSRVGDVDANLRLPADPTRN